MTVIVLNGVTAQHRRRRLLPTGLLEKQLFFLIIFLNSYIHHFNLQNNNKKLTSQSVKNTVEKGALPPGLHFPAGAQLVDLTVVGSLNCSTLQSC